VRKWRVKSETNHYFDATYMAAVAASMLGISAVAGSPSQPRQRVRLSDLQKAKRGPKV
jgi:hypothetical protein